MVCVSYHGLQNGTHTYEATWAGPDDVPIPSSVKSMRECLDRITDSSEHNGESAFDAEEMTEVEAQLENLGYI